MARCICQLVISDMTGPCSSPRPMFRRLCDDVHVEICTKDLPFFGMLVYLLMTTSSFTEFLYLTLSPPPATPSSVVDFISPPVTYHLSPYNGGWRRGRNGTYDPAHPRPVIVLLGALKLIRAFPVLKITRSNYHVYCRPPGSRYGLATRLQGVFSARLTGHINNPPPPLCKHYLRDAYLSSGGFPTRLPRVERTIDPCWQSAQHERERGVHCLSSSRLPRG